MLVLAATLAAMPASSDELRFYSDASHQENRALQARMSPQTLQQLRSYGVTDASELRLEYFFYTDTAAKASALAEVLAKKGYKSGHGESAGDDKMFVVTGWTSPMLMNEKTVVKWTREMCRLGFEHDCEFDGWGTNPTQE